MERDFLAGEGLRLMQGYLFAKPAFRRLAGGLLGVAFRRRRNTQPTPDGAACCSRGCMTGESSGTDSH